MSNWYLKETPRVYLRDPNYYVINRKVIDDTCMVLDDYRNLNPSNEGLVYWAGIRDGDCSFVKMVFAPDAISEERRIVTSHASNAQYVKQLATSGFVHIGQVHSHPGRYVDHSEGDDEWTPFKRPGLISIVVESYGRLGMLPLKNCGVHKFVDNEFVRVNETYIKERFTIIEDENTLFKDFRRWKG